MPHGIRIYGVGWTWCRATKLDTDNGQKPRSIGKGRLDLMNQRIGITTEIRIPGRSDGEVKPKGDARGRKGDGAAGFEDFKALYSQVPYSTVQASVPAGF